MKGTVICDGRGNAGTGARAAVLYDENMEKIDERAEKIDPTTNIVAEHLSIQLGMELALEHGVTDLVILNDSQTPVNHVLGTYKARQSHIKPLVEKTWELGRRFAAVNIRWVPREQTHVADRLCRKVDSVKKAKRKRPGGHLEVPARRNPFVSMSDIPASDAAERLLRRIEDNGREGMKSI